MGMVSKNTVNEESTSVECSVCIANYNGEKIIRNCIDSVLSQNFSLPVEVIVHDDNSTDGSIAIIKEEFPQVKLLQSSKNVGFCISNNRMVEKALGKYILLLNNDAVLFSDALKTLYKCAQKSGNGVFGLPQYNAASGELIDRGSLVDFSFNVIPNLDKDRTDVAMIIGACLFIKKSLWHEIGGFPNWFGSMAEDLYVSSIVRLKGLPVRVADESGFHHWVGQSFGGGKIIEKKLVTTYSRRKLSEKNRLSVLFITFPTVLAWMLVLLNLLFLFVEGLILSILKKDKRIFLDIYFSSILSILWTFPLTVKDRVRVQAMQNCSVVSFCKLMVLCPYKLKMLLKYGLPKLKR